MPRKETKRVLKETKESPLHTNELRTSRSIKEAGVKKLKRKGIKSPSIQKMTLVKGKTSMIPNTDVSTPELLEAWRKKTIEKYGL